MLRRAALSLIAAGLAGCASPPPAPLTTPSGRPEVYIRGATRKAVIDKVVADKLGRGATVRSVTDYGVVVGLRLEGDLAASLLFGSRYDGTPELRVTYNVVDVSGGVRVFSRTEIVGNPGSAFERVTDMTSRAAREMQAELESLRATF